MLDPRLGSVQVQAAILDVLVNLLGSFQEGVLHVLASAQANDQHVSIRKEAAVRTLC